MSRLSWEKYFLSLAEQVAERTDCRRSKVGAVLVDHEHRIVGTGYPGTAPGEPGCLDGACPRGLLSNEECAPLTAYDNCISVHAEANALLNSDRSRYEGGTIYVTREPCHWCYKLIKAAGISFAIFFDQDSPIGYSYTDMHQWRAVPNG